jgi:hypothetical protein
MARAARATRKPRARVAVPPGFRAVLAAFANNRRVTRERMFSSDNVLTTRGKIFAMLVRGKLVTKLPKERVDELVTRGIGTRFDPGHGRLMKEWVVVAPGRARWVALAQEAYQLVRQGQGARRRERDAAPAPGKKEGLT